MQSRGCPKRCPPEPPRSRYGLTTPTLGRPHPLTGQPRRPAPLGLTDLAAQESRHRLARKIFHGQRGELRQRYREGQEDLRPGPERRRAVKNPLHRRCPHAVARAGVPGPRCGRRPPVPARRRPPQRPRTVRLQATDGKVYGHCVTLPNRPKRADATPAGVR